MSRKVYKVSLNGHDYGAELAFPVGCYWIYTDGTVCQQIPGFAPGYPMDNPPDYPLFVYDEVMCAIRHQRCFLMKKLSELQRAEEIMKKVHDDAVYGKWVWTKVASEMPDS